MKQKTPHYAPSVAAIAAIVLAVTLGSASAQVRGVIERAGTGQRISGVIRWRPASKVYEVKMQSGTVSTIPLRQVSNIRISNVPNGLEDAVRRVQGGSYQGGHIGLLEKVCKDYEMLQYDLLAGRWLAEAYLNTGRAAEAAKLCDGIMANRDKSEVDAAFVKVYWDVLIQTEQYSTLRRELAWGIESGPREVAAVAQMTRGKMDMKRKDYRQALVDGFLRTILMFGMVKDVQPEALYNAALCFEELGEGPHAAKMRKKLLAEYPDSEYSRKLQTGS